MDRRRISDRLPKTDCLDLSLSREEAAKDAVWIPGSELELFRHELSRRGSSLRVSGGRPEAIEWLHRAGYHVQSLQRESDAEPDDKPRSRLFDVEPSLAVWEEGAGRTVLDLGCGAGRDALWLAANGWRVTAVDRLAENIARLERSIPRYLDDEGSIAARVATIEDSLTEPSSGFDLVLLHYVWNSAWSSGLIRRIAPGGWLQIVSFDPDAPRSGTKPPPSPEHCFQDRDLRAFEGFEVAYNGREVRPDRDVRAVRLQRPLSRS